VASVSAAASGLTLERVKARWHWLIPFVVIGGLMWPLLFSDRTFSSDWGNHLWIVWEQGLNIKHLGLPSYYLQSNLGAFYPYFAFYGGTLYAVLGYVSWLTSPETAVALVFLAALASAYLSWTWIAGMAGVRGWWTQIPGAIAVTAPYAVTNLYGRGDIPEMVATAAIPLVAASALSLVRSQRVRFWPAAAYVVGVVALTGTHTLTLVWGATFLVLFAGVFVAAYWSQVKEHSRRGLRLIWLGLLGIGINAWILVPLLLFHTRLLEGDPDPLSHLEFTDRSQLFSLLRDGGALSTELTADVNAQLPVLALIVAIALLAVYWTALPRNGKRLLLGVAGLGAVFGLLILSPSLIEDLPRVWRFIQFPYRLVTFVDLAAVGLVTMALVAMGRSGAPARIPALLLAAVAGLAFVQSLRQNGEVRSFLPGRAAALESSVHTPQSWYAPLQFADGSAPIVHPTLPTPLHVPVAEGPRDSYEVSYPPGPAGTVRTNVLAGTYLVDVSGAEPVGRNAGGYMIVRLPASNRPRQVTVKAGWDTGVEIGRWLTVISLLAAALATGYAVARRGQPEAV
jgi:hypothetical protein